MPTAEQTSEGETIERETIDGWESKLTKLKGEKENRSDCAMSRKEGAEAKTVTKIPSPKNRRKIRQPKQYIPKPQGEKETNETQGDSEEPSASLDSTLNQSSIVSEESNHDNSVLQENDEVHALTASQEKEQEKPNPTAPKRAHATQAKAKRPGNRPSNKKTRNSNQPVPKKPEDLIREAIACGRPSVQATKRDAQYRKSYAYKIWKERATSEVRSDCTEPQPGTTQAGTAYPQVSPSQQHNQGGAMYYWPPSQYNDANNTGFYANGKYYEINPSAIHGVHNGPQMTTIVPQTAGQATTTSVIQASTPSVVPAVQHGTILPPVSLEAYHSGGSNPASAEKIAAKGGTQLKSIVKPGPPNVVVIPQYPAKFHQNRVSPPAPVNSSSSPSAVINQSYPQSPGPEIPSPAVIQQPSPPQNSTLEKAQETDCQPSPNETNDLPPAKDTSVDQKTSSGLSTSPSSFVSLMKTTLNKKHCKENVQPLAVCLKSNLKKKRKLEAAHELRSSSTKKKAKPTIFTPLNEQEAEKLANDIYDVNLEYFPFQTLAEKAAQSKEGANNEETEAGNKVGDIERVRCLLKDFYDVTYSCTEDPDMQKFDSASRKFGRKNILNHLSLLDRYFAELQKKVVGSKN